MRFRDEADGAQNVILDLDSTEGDRLEIKAPGLPQTGFKAVIDSQTDLQTFAALDAVVALQSDSELDLQIANADGKTLGVTLVGFGADDIGIF